MRNNARDVAWFTTLRDDCRDTRTCRQPCCYNLGAHTACSQGTAGRAYICCQLCNIFHNSNGFCVWVGARILVVQTVHIRHKEEVIRLDHTRSYSTQRIVVTKLDFCDGQSIVLVHNRNDTHAQEFNECILRILVLCSVGNVVSRQKHLSNWLLQIAKQLIP